MTLAGLFEDVRATPLSTAMRESGWLFPTAESIHVLAVGLVVGSIVIVDLRLLGLTSRRKPVTELASEVLPWTWAAFALAVVSGLLMFIGQPDTYLENLPFRLKLVCLVLAGLNMLIFHVFAYRSVAAWDQDRPTVMGAKLAGVLSLTFWVGVVVFGRWIGFTITG